MNVSVIARAERGGHTAYGVRPVVTAIVILWFASVVGAHYAGLLRSPAGNLPIAFGLAVGAPVLIFFAAYRAVPRFRAAVLGVDIGFVTTLR